MKMNKRSNGSPMMKRKRKRKSFNQSLILKRRMKSAPASASILPGMSAALTIVSTPPASLNRFPQLSYSSLTPISTPSLSSATGTSSRPVPSISARPLLAPVQGIVDSHILILPTADRAQMLSRRSKRWRRRTFYRGMVARGPASTPAGLGHPLTRENGRGICKIRVVHPAASTKEIVGRHAIRQTLVKSAGGSNKDHIYGFGSRFFAINTERQGGSISSSSVSSVSSPTAHDARIKREKRLWGYTQQA
ncbi:hypothetical protein M9H77_07768 [Catharanthus roseus]|uniref:Uncharacterized protein n=1 Tax=Catharanthus roseus TaxID=4058 RepID=A0ACC0BW51_CATRO|nr:hypothetical protein M9H77_07768 [Catharanthus roseus]